MDSQELSSAPLTGGPSHPGPPTCARPRSGKPGGRRNQVNGRGSLHSPGRAQSPGVGRDACLLLPCPKGPGALCPGPCDSGPGAPILWPECPGANSTFWQCGCAPPETTQGVVPWFLPCLHSRHPLPLVVRGGGRRRATQGQGSPGDGSHLSFAL